VIAHACLLLQLGACAPQAWREPTAANSAICDAADARADVGRPTHADLRPRPECRPAPTR